MAAETVPYGRATQQAPAVAEVHILWITAGLGCDGDSVSITAATQPSIEDVLLGAIPGCQKFTCIIPSWLMKMATISSSTGTRLGKGSSNPLF
jgi:Ni,Fe-hydrogenase I small subunit